MALFDLILRTHASLHPDGDPSEFITEYDGLDSCTDDTTGAVSRAESEMVHRRAKAVGIETRIGCHTFRTTDITNHLVNDGTLDIAQALANHESARTTKLYDRRNDKLSLDEVERITI